MHSPVPVPRWQVASARASFKGAPLRFMPNALLQPLKRVRYLNTVRSFWSPEADVMVALIEEGDYVLDLGAYVGWYTRVLSQAHLPRGHTERFAPSRISQEVDARPGECRYARPDHDLDAIAQTCFHTRLNVEEHLDVVS